MKSKLPTSYDITMPPNASWESCARIYTAYLIDSDGVNETDLLKAREEVIEMGRVLDQITRLGNRSPY
jgi:hypothetical protein